jgi:Fe-S-cluster-containing hydrogenase component 2
VQDTDLYQSLAACVGAAGSSTIERIFRILADAREARLLMAASPPATLEQLAERTGLDTAEIQAMVHALFQKGLLFFAERNGVRKYYRVRHVPQLHDATAVAPDASPELLDLWRHYTDNEWTEYARKIEAFVPQAPIRVIPVNVTMEASSKILAFDDVRKVVEEAGSLAVTRCTCRLIARRCDKPLEVCIQVNRAAEYALARGTGRAISKEEAVGILRECEEAGLVHVVDNRREVDHVICNCCQCCCMNWPPVKAGVKRFVVPSRFAASVDPETCSGCEACLERCYFQAIQMGGQGGTALVDRDKCMGCGLCAVTCPTGAMRLEEVRPEEFIPA